jgi:hypothetical protein
LYFNNCIKTLPAADTTSNSAPSGAEPSNMNPASSPRISSEDNTEQRKGNATPVSQSSKTKSPAAASNASTSSSGPAAPARGSQASASASAILTALRSGASKSRFQIAHTFPAAIFGWTEPILSGLVFCVLCSVFIALSALAYSLPSLLTSALLFTLIISGAIRVYSAQMPNSPLKTFQIPKEAEDHLVEVLRGSERAMKTGIQALNKALSWTDVKYSLTALAYAWVASYFSFLLTPGWLFLGA